MPLTPSPLRYPGGKTKLYNLIQPIVAQNISGNDRTYIEPFAGGSGLALKLLYNNDVDRLILNDIDYCIYCFWYSCLNHTEQLCEMIINCSVNIDTWKIKKSIYSTPESYSKLEVGFATFFLNRCNVSGVIQGGPIGGFEQLGTYLIGARFNKKDLVDKIKKIGMLSDRIVFYNMDATTFLQSKLPKDMGNNIFLNIDPPYVKKGKLLYENSFNEMDHTELSCIVKSLNYKWIVTYDECDLISQLYADCRKQIISLNYSAGRTRKGNEFLIFGNLVKILDGNTSADIIEIG
jgi:DNA adenine methylase